MDSSAHIGPSTVRSLLTTNRNAVGCVPRLQIHVQRSLRHTCGIVVEGIHYGSWDGRTATRGEAKVERNRGYVLNLQSCRLEGVFQSSSCGQKYTRVTFRPKVDDRIGARAGAADAAGSVLDHPERFESMSVGPRNL